MIQALTLHSTNTGQARRAVNFQTQPLVWMFTSLTPLAFEWCLSRSSALQTRSFLITMKLACPSSEVQREALTHSYGSATQGHVPPVDILVNARENWTLSQSKSSTLMLHCHVGILALSVLQPWKLKEKPKSAAHVGYLVQSCCRRGKFCILGPGSWALHIGTSSQFLVKYSRKE